MFLSDELYTKFIKLVYKHTGIFYEYNKKYYVHKKVERRAQLLQLDSLNEYYQLIKFSDYTSEFNQLINDLTVNETYFFRDFPQLRNFAEDLLPLLVRKKEKSNQNKIRIWSAACSTGEEPYTLAIILQEMLDNPEQWDIEIIASDINTQVLKEAQNGLYEERAIRDVPPEYLEKYFIKRQDKYMLVPKVKRFVKFMNINLMDAEMTKVITSCDVIFCRNCLIYFDDTSRKEVLLSFYESLSPGGYILLGHSESVGRISSSYHVQKIGDSIIYSKPS